jgi:hypothetical protein
MTSPAPAPQEDRRLEAWGSDPVHHVHSRARTTRPRRWSWPQTATVAAGVLGIYAAGLRAHERRLRADGLHALAAAAVAARVDLDEAVRQLAADRPRPAAFVAGQPPLSTPDRRARLSSLGAGCRGSGRPFRAGGNPGCSGAPARRHTDSRDHWRFTEAAVAAWAAAR